MSYTETYTLENGVKIPKIGLGTGLIDGEAAIQLCAPNPLLPGKITSIEILQFR